MKHPVTVLFFLFFSLACFSQSYNTDLQALDRTIGQAARYDKEKEKAIAVIKTTIEHSGGEKLFDGYERLYEEYKVYNYDSAYSYAQKALNIAKELNNDFFITQARIKISFTLLSSGLFKEAFDSLDAIRPRDLDDRGKTEYYTLLARCYYDLADYTSDKYHSPGYNKEATLFLDSALLLLSPSGFEYSYYNGLKNIRAGNIEKAMAYFRTLMNDPGLSLHEVALTTSTMSDIYIQKGQIDTAIRLLVTAATADIRSSTKETSAIFNLSSVLFKKGDLKNASTYIEKAVEDALFYGARQRKVQMSAILPLIEGEKIARVENEKRTVTTYAVIVTLLLLLLIYLVIVIARQIRKLKKAQQAITEAHIQQRAINTRLIEANKIKEEYIGFFFNANTAFYDKIERFKAKVEQKVADRKLDDIRFLLNSLSIRQEREELLKNFDNIFLKLFPHFIPEYNALFKPEDITVLKENEVLNTDLRIFALIRLGIHDNDKIAHILGYSVNTINTYKTRIKNRSLIMNEDFEAKIMEIRSV